jgi:sigma-B regulation protein RsbU (phosphoserine phosphatase)
MAFDELLTNVISYAYDDEGQHKIDIRVSLLNDAVVIVITDSGIPFNPFQMKTPDTEASIDDRDIGGLGVHLVREMLDQVNYQRKVDQNVVTLVKGIDPEF